MKRLLLILMLLVASTGCQVQIEPPTHSIAQAKVRHPVVPTVDIPYEYRQSNWFGPQGEGSCVHASVVNLFRIQGRFDLANWWRRHNGDGEWDTDLAKKFDNAKVQYAYTYNKGDVKFLEWACNSRRGCAVSIMGCRHMVNLVHIDKHWAGILDNNDKGHIIWVPRSTFVSEWLNSDSWAVAVVYTPLPPRPLTPNE